VLEFFSVLLPCAFFISSSAHKTAASAATAEISQSFPQQQTTTTPATEAATKDCFKQLIKNERNFNYSLTCFIACEIQLGTGIYVTHAPVHHVNGILYVSRNLRPSAMNLKQTTFKTN